MFKNNGQGETSEVGKKAEEKAAKERARQVAEVAKKAKVAAAMARKEEEKAAKEKARQEAEAAKKAQIAAAMAKKEEERAAKEKARQEAEAAKKAQVAAAMAKKAEDRAAKEKARQEAEAAKKLKVAAAMARKAEDRAAKEKARQEAEAAKKAQVAAAMAKKEEEKAAEERALQEAEAAEKAQEERIAELRARRQAEAARKAQLAAYIGKKVEEVITMVQNNGPEVTSSTRRKTRKPAISMVPILNWRTILAVVTGLIVGAGLGLGYWIMSPSLSMPTLPEAETEEGGLAAYMGMSQPQATQYESTVDIQIVFPGTSYSSPKDLQYRGECYTAKANSIPFLSFLSQELTEQAPDYSHTANELDEIIEIRYNWNSDFPAIEVKAIGSSAEEASFLAGFVPQAFTDYLIAEERDSQQQEYQNTLEEIEAIKASVLEAEQARNAIKAQLVASDNFSIDPQYVALNAKIAALELELNHRAEEMSTFIASGDTTETEDNNVEREYQKALLQAKSVSSALAEAEWKLRTIEVERAASDNISNDATYITLNAKIKALEDELDLYSAELAAYIAEGKNSKSAKQAVDRISAAIVETKEELATLESLPKNDNYLASDLAYQLAKTEVDNLSVELSAWRDRLTQLASSDDSPSDPQAAFERTSAALAKAKEELAILDSQGNNLVLEDLDYQVAQNKVDTLNKTLAGLTESLGYFFSDDVEVATILDSLVAGNPSLPQPILPERARARNVLMMGAIVGIGGAWTILNFKWLAKGMPSSSSIEEEEDEEA